MVEFNERWLGLALRHEHRKVWQESTKPPLLEILIDNYLGHKGGPWIRLLDHLRDKTQMTFHSLGMDLGGTAALDLNYLQEMKRLIQRYGPIMVSDHLAYCRGEKIMTYDLLPIPLTPASLQRVKERVHQVQEILGQRICLENISSYFQWQQDSIPEMEFLNDLCQSTGCGILLDINNLIVSTSNLKQLLPEVLSSLRPQHIWQYHMAAHTSRYGLKHDTHEGPLTDSHLRLAKTIFKSIGKRPMILERENASIEELMESRNQLIDQWRQSHETPGISLPRYPTTRSSSPSHPTPE